MSPLSTDADEDRATDERRPRPDDHERRSDDRERPAGDDEHRPLIERIGMAMVAAALAALFAGVSLAAYSGGELFLGTMAAIGCLMTVWVGALTLFRG
jgi:hypothetical protein